jgi:hypothetical protein
MLIWYLHYIYKFYVLSSLRQFTYDKKAIAIKKSVKKKKKEKREKRETTTSMFMIHLTLAQR